MRLFFNASLLGTAGTGLERFSRELLLEMAKLDLHITAIIAHPKIDLPQEIETIPIAQAPISDGQRLLWLNTVLPLKLLQYKTSLYFSPTSEALLLPPCKQVFTLLDLIPLFYPDQAPAATFYYRRVVPWLLRASSGLVTISEHTQQDIRRMYPNFDKPIKVAYPGYRQTTFWPKDLDVQQQVLQKYQLSNKPFVFFLGEARPYKNISGILEGFAEAQLPDHLLVVAGRMGDQEQGLRQKATDLGIAERTRFLGFVSDEDLAALYSACAVFVFASLYEGFGIPPLEAMACGAPVVLSRVASLPEVCAEAAVYIDPQSTPSIARGIREVALNPHKRQALKALGLERAKQFSYKRAAMAVVDILKTV